MDWQAAKQLFHEALDLPPEARSAFLATQSHDEELRNQVELLLRAHDEAGEFIATPALVEAGFAATESSEPDYPTHLIGSRVGPYEIVRELGRGGMGAVFLATRIDTQFEKQVAIKIVKRGMDTDSILRRFAMERQILANLEHNNIARLLDGGTTDNGLSYFILEYVDGVPITAYCDEHRLNTTERLQLFLKVCAAVQYAHQNLIVHRDLKPRNILVTADGTPKLLDFGIAKLLHPAWSADRTEQTATALQLMTPEYASPEQLRGLPVTTATDVFSLGVVLYELLSGRRPFRFQSRSPEEIARVLLTQEPLRPSSAITRSEEPKGTDEQETTVTAESLSLTREGRVDKLRRRLHGDLDNIVLKALRKEPERRYASVQQFAEDIRRHLAGLPVTARPDTFSYRAVKFIQRHRAGVAAAAMILVTLISAVALTTWQARVARRERDLAQRRFNQVRKLANLVVFDYHDKIQTLPGSTAVREKMIKDAIEYLDNLSADSQNDPGLQEELASAYEKVGNVQGNPYDANLGDAKGALTSLQKALALRQELHKQNPADEERKFQLAKVYATLGDVFWGSGSSKESLDNYQQAFKVFNELAAANPNTPRYRSALAATLNGIGHVQEQLGDHRAALESYRQMLVHDESLAAGDPANSEYKRSIAIAHIKIGDTIPLADGPQAILEHYQKSAALLSELAAADPNNMRYMRDLSLIYARLGNTFGLMKQYDNDIQYLTKATEIDNQIIKVDPDNVQARFDLATSYLDLGDILKQVKRFAEAISNSEKAIDLFEATLKKSPGQTQPLGYLAVSYQTLSEIFLAQKNYKAAYDNVQKSLEILEAEPVRSSKLVHLAVSYEDMGNVCSETHDWRTAQTWYQKALDLFRQLEREQKIDADDDDAEGVTKKLAKCAAALKK